MLPPKIKGSIPLLKEKLEVSMSMPTATNRIKPIADTQFTRMSNSVPKTLNRLRNHSSMSIQRALADAHNAFAKFVIFRTPM